MIVYWHNSIEQNYKVNTLINWITISTMTGSQCSEYLSSWESNFNVNLLAKGVQFMKLYSVFYITFDNLSLFLKICILGDISFAIEPIYNNSVVWIYDNIELY